MHRPQSDTWTEPFFCPTTVYASSHSVPQPIKSKPAKRQTNCDDCDRCEGRMDRTLSSKTRQHLKYLRQQQPCLSQIFPPHIRRRNIRSSSPPSCPAYSKTFSCILQPGAHLSSFNLLMGRAVDVPILPKSMTFYLGPILKPDFSRGSNTVYIV